MSLVAAAALRFSHVLICASCGRENPEGCCTAASAAPPAPTPERRKLVTLLFCYMSGSTAMGERVDAETVRQVMLSY